MNLLNYIKGMKTYWFAGLLFLLSVFGVANNLFTQQQIEAGVGIFSAIFAATFRSAMKTETENQANKTADLIADKTVDKQVTVNEEAVKAKAIEVLTKVVAEMTSGQPATTTSTPVTQPNPQDLG